MPKPRRIILTAATLLAAAAFLASLLPPVMAETLRCRSVNGNLNCAGSGGVSCQTVDGRTTCVGGNGAVVQQFGAPQRPAPGRPAPDRPAARPDVAETADPEAWREEEEAAPARPQRGVGRLSIERRSPWGNAMTLERDGSRLRLRTERGITLDLD